MDKNDVEILSEKDLYKGHFHVKQIALRHRLFAGGWSQTITREVFSRGDAVAALLFDPHLEQIVLIEQFRVGAISPEQSPWLTEVVAGLMDKDHETASEVIIREAKEEAGLAIQDLMPIHEYWVSPGGFTERVILFCGKVDASIAGGIHGLASEEEDIKVLVWDIEKAFSALKQGEINNAMTIIALQWLKLNYEQVMSKWK